MSQAQLTMIDEYKGRVISLDMESKKFHVTDADISRPYFASFDEATAAIDQADKIKLKAASIDLRLEVLKHDGSGKTEIKGINQREGKLLFTDGQYSKKARESYGNADEVYPPVAWIAERLAERHRLGWRITEINRELHKVEIKVHRGYGFKSAEDYEAAINVLRREYEQKCDAARAKETHTEQANEPLNLSD
jgi:hypothetical protein